MYHACPTDVAYQFHNLCLLKSSDTDEFDSDATLDLTLPVDEKDSNSSEGRPVVVGMKRQATEVR